MNFRKLTKLFACLLLCAFVINGCKKVEDVLPPEMKDKNVEFYLLVKGRQLVKFNARDLAKPLSTVDLDDGVLSGEVIVSIDFRPATGELYGLGSSSRIYVINPETGKLRAIGNAPFSPTLASTMVGFDFNPVVDRIRVVTSSGQNLRINPETGAVMAVDGMINGAAGASVTAVAYTNNVAGAASTILYDIDVANKKLFKQDPPNNGTLVEVGSLGADIMGEGGFDIAPDGYALAVFGDKIYHVNLETGKATKLGGFANYSKITGIAIRTNPVAYAVDEMNNLLVFNPMNPEPVTKPIMGLPSGEMIEGIDFRPLNGQLYALSSASKLYTLNTSNGAATMVGMMPFSTMLMGTSFGFDFNPMVDRIRIVSNTGQNLRANPETGGIAAVDMNINPAGATVTAVAYTNNFAGTTSTVLFDIDAASDKLFKQDPPNNGTLVEVGALGVDVMQTAGFDIGGASNKGYAILTSGGTAKIYSVNLTTGRVSAVAAFPKSVKGFAVGLGF